MAGGRHLPLEAPEPDKVYNSCVVWPGWPAAARYDKIHLFGFSGLGERYCGADTITPGKEEIVAVDTPAGAHGFIRVL